MSRKRKQRRKEKQESQRPAPKQKTKKKKPPAPVKLADFEPRQEAPLTAPGLSPGLMLAIVALIIIAGTIAYFNSFGCVFLFDDNPAVLQNRNIRSLWPIWTAMTSPHHSTVSGRPLLSLTLALNYAISEYQVWSYHLFNLVFHLLAALALFGIVRRTLLARPLRDKFGPASTLLALACSLIWLVHPLQTGSVTYVVQRAESLMGLFYLLTIYCAIRSFESPGRRRWPVLAVIACFLAAITKEVTATLPVILLIYDRAFYTSSFKECLRKRRRLYAFLAALWIIPIITTAAGARKASGFDFPISPLDYFKMQCNIVFGYLRLVFWPGSLTFDYGRPIIRGFFDYAPAGLVLLVLGSGTLLAVWKRPHIGFLGAWFFGILAPSSSFLIIAHEIGAEHRMYLPSAAVICGAVLGVYWLGKRFLKGKAAMALGLAATISVVSILAGLTHLRNRDYQSLVAIWSDSVQKTPNNFRAQHHLALSLAREGDLETSIHHFSRTIELRPRHDKAFTNRGITYSRLEQYDLAMEDLTTALELNPRDSRALMFRAKAYARQGYYQEAIDDLNRALRLVSNPKTIGQIRNRINKYRRMLQSP